MYSENDIAKILMETAEKIKALGNAEEVKEDVTKTPAGVHTAIRLHGSSGIFSSAGLERDVITAHVRPHGIASILPIFPSVYEAPLFPSITGFTAATGSEPETACEDAPYAFMKGCNLTARFGMARRDTNTIEFDKVMLKLHRGDMTDLRLRGRLLGLTDLEPGGLSEGQVLDIITMAEMVTVGVGIERLLNSQIWNGSFLVGTQFPGLASQIATGQRDAELGTLCPALDSDVKSYNYALLGESIVEYLSMLAYYLEYNATAMGLDPVRWVVVMRPELWFELSSIWPCAYNTNKCANAVATNGQVFIDGRENVAQRDSMRSGNYIDINGKRYDVITDTGIFEHTNVNNANVPAGQYASSIFIVPLTITGGFPVTYREHIDYSKGAGDTALLRGAETFWTDGGMFSWALEQTKWCYKLSVKTEQRIILRTPQLAGRIDAVRYAPLQHLRSDDPSSSYFADGGVSIRPMLSDPYAIWSSR